MTTQENNRAALRRSFPRQGRAPSPASDTGQATVLRSAVVVALIGMALIHLLDVQEKIDEAWLVGWSFVGLIAVSLLLADVLGRVDDLRAWVLAGLLAAATIIGFSMSRSFGLPTEHDSDVGNWSEPLGLASLLCEAVVIWACVTRLARMPRSSRG